MRDYGRVFCALWRSRDFRSLSEDGRALVQYLLTCPHGTMIGAFDLPDGYICEDIQWAPERVREGFAELFAKGFATRCEATHWVWIAKYLDWNQPDNPNQWKAARKLVAKVPGSCSWVADFKEYFECSLEAYEADKEAEKAPPKRNRSRTVSKPGTGTGTGTGEGSGGGTGTGTVTGAGTRANSNGTHGNGIAVESTEPGEGPEDFDGEDAHPSEPSNRNGSQERRNGDFEAINEAVSKVLASGVCKPGEYKTIAKIARISALQAEISVRQLRDRGRLPTQASAA